MMVYVFAMEEFSTAITRRPGECGLEIMAQAMGLGERSPDLPLQGDPEREPAVERELLSCRHLRRLQHPRLEVPVGPVTP